MAIPSDITSLSKGASFYRADLHIHSFGGSHDVSDATMTPANIVKTAIAERLNIISIADHNEIRNVSAAMDAAASTGLLVVPGVELSTPQGHLLAYLPTFAALSKFYGQIDIADTGTQNSRCQTGILECLKVLEAHGGFGILAHVDAEKGFEVETPGSSPHKVDVICHPALVGIELKTSRSMIRYGDGDDDVSRVKMGALRAKRLKLGSKQFLAPVLFSDSHTLAALGRNASGDKKVTRVKMETPSFAALRIALDDSDARVRIEELIPASIPYVCGVSLSGGFLDGQQIHFSPNLNCIIGGRGTGKSTTFQAVKCLEGPNNARVVDSEVWPAELRLYWRDAAGGDHTVQKISGEDMLNLDDADLGPTTFKLESYGQGDTARLSSQAQNDPLALLGYLDGFIDVGAPKHDEMQATTDLLELQTEIEKAEEQVARIPDFKRYLATVQNQLQIVEKEKAKDIIQLQRNLEAERAIRSRLQEDWKATQATLAGQAGKEKLAALKKIAQPAEVTVGVEEFAKIMNGLDSLDSSIATATGQISTEIGVFGRVMSEQILAWKAKDTAAVQRIEAKRKELEGKGVRLDMPFIQKLAKDEASHQQSLNNLNTWVPHLAEQKKKRAAALKRRWAARDRIGMLRDAYAAKATAILKSTLNDLEVSLSFKRNACAPDAANQIKEAAGWKTNQVPRAALLVEGLTVPNLLKAIGSNDPAPISSLAYDDGTRPFDRAAALDLISKLAVPAVRFALERCAIDDLPEIVVRKKVLVANGKPAIIKRDFSKLSLGQQQSILLSLLLSSNSTDPLIIDQPEDNLDSEFIYSTFVPVLRRAKERRQIIIVTHNANIAVLGDAEQIVVMKAQNDHGVIVARGSIDDPDTRDFACAILEGAKEAFARRAKIYGM